MVGDFRRVINPIRVKIGERYANVFIEIKFEDGRLSISGVEGPLPSGSARGSAGQIDMGYRNDKKDVKFNNGWNLRKWNTLLSIWDKYHLNNMHAGTRKQEKALQKKFGTSRVDYDKAVEYLKSIGLYEDNGYRYGSGWLTQEVPEKVLEWLKNLKNTTNRYAWV